MRKSPTKSKATVEQQIIAMLPWSSSSFGKQAEIDGFNSSSGKWETIAIVNGISGVDAEDVASFIIEAIVSHNGVATTGTTDKQESFARNAPSILSPRESEVLKFLASGKSREEIAQLLPIKAVTVRAYLESAREKLSAKNILHAATLAVAKGLIELIEDVPLKNESSRTENTKDRKNLVLGRHVRRKTPNQKQKAKGGNEK